MSDPVETEARADRRRWLADEYAGPTPAEQAAVEVAMPEDLVERMCDFLAAADAEADRFAGHTA